VWLVGEQLALWFGVVGGGEGEGGGALPVSSGVSSL